VGDRVVDHLPVTMSDSLRFRQRMASIEVLPAAFFRSK
jgi:hypothetical protein